MTPLLSHAVLIGGFLLVAVVALVLLIRCNAEVTIQGFSWKRNVFLEHLIWIEEFSYDGFPDGSRNHRTEIEKYRSYRQTGQVPVSQVINGQSITTMRPTCGYVWKKRTKYCYEVQQWVESRELRADGVGREGVHWPAYSLGEQERVGHTEAIYQAIFKTVKGKEKTYTVSFPEEEWLALDEAALYNLQLSLFQKVLQVDLVE